MKKAFSVQLPSPAMIVAVVALFVALGGTGYAALALPKNSIGGKQLRNGAVSTSKIANGAVTARKINPSGLTVPKALHANTANTAGSAADAGHASNADNATHASSADTATNATHASNADNATNATHASNADNATNATHASSADTATNATHADSADNATNATHASSADNATDAAHAASATTAAGLSTLPSGATESGSFAVAVAGGADYLGVGITFHQPLAAPLVHLEATTSTSTNCPGVGQAAPGYLCLYVANINNTFTTPPYGYLDSPTGAGKYGVALYWLVNDTTKGAYINGSWSVTAS